MDQARQRKRGLPIDARVEGFCKYPGRFDRRVVWILDDECLRSICLVVGHRKRVAQTETSNSERRTEARRRLPRVPLESDRIFDSLRIREKAVGELSGLVEIELLVRLEAECRGPVQPSGHRNRRRTQAEHREGAVHFLASGVLAVRAAEIERGRPEFRGIVGVRRDRCQHLRRIEGRSPLNKGIGDVVDVRVKMRVLGEALVVVPADARVRASIALCVTVRSEPASHETIEPPILQLSVQTHPARIARRRTAAAAPVERELRVHVIADREVVA